MCQNTGRLLHFTIMLKKSRRFKRYSQKIVPNCRNSLQKWLYIITVYRKRMVWKLHCIIKVGAKQLGKYTKKVRSLKAAITGAGCNFPVCFTSRYTKQKVIGIYELSSRNSQLYKQWKYEFVSVLYK